MSLADQYNLSANPLFIQRVESALVVAALAVGSEAPNDQQTVSITGSPTGGTFTLTYNGQTTAALAFNATAGAIQQAFAGLTNVGTNNVAVTGGPLPGTAVVITFMGSLGSTAQNLITHTDSLTGGASPAASVAHTTVGSSRAGHAILYSYAQKVLANPFGYATLVSIAVAANATVQTDFPPPNYTQSGGVTTVQADSDIQFQVNSIFPTLAGA